MAGEGQYGERYENPHIGPRANMGADMMISKIF